MELQKNTQNFNIDFVFPYVNPKDPIWQKKYEYCSGKNDYSSNVRFRDFSMLKYIFRSIDLYAPYIHNVFLLVADENQVPSFLRKKYYRLKIITHDQFIPKEYLPTFNSNTIEMFLPFIPELSEHFIYSNDDFLFLNPTTYLDFFDISGQKIKLCYSYMNNAFPTNFQFCCKSTWDIIASLFTKRKIDNKEYTYIKQEHGCASPRLLSDCKECFSKLEPKILKSLTMFRSFGKNYNQYLYGYYSLFKGNFLKNVDTTMHKYLDFSSYSLNSILYMLNNDDKIKMICINDTNKMKEKDIQTIYKELDLKYPRRSIFEV